MDKKEKGYTLWEKTIGMFDAKKSQTIFNPLGIDVGRFIWLDVLDYRDIQFRVVEISEYTREIGSKTFRFTDYHAQDTGATNKIILRYNPMDNPLPGSKQTNNVLLLKFYDELGYSEDFLNVVTDTTKQFEVREGDVVTELYWRVNDVQDPYLAKVASITTEAPEELANQEIKYWDYWRETEDEANQKVVEFLFVEMDTESGWFQLWKGQEIDPYAVKTI